jgi:hypothetical protein
MRASLICLVCFSLLTVAGCQPGMDAIGAGSAAVNVAKGKAMDVSISLPKRQWKIGDTIPVEVVAVNTTGSPIDIASPTGAPVLVRVARPSRMSFEQVRVYPAGATSNILNWTLPARGSRTFTLMVPVEPDWPVAESLYISAELNGYPQYSPSVAITVEPRGQTAR